MSNKVTRHPEREQIIQKLLNGESTKSVSEWLKKKHPKSKRLHISWITLQKFRKEELDLYGDTLADLKSARKQRDSEDRALEVKAIVANSSTYQEKINEIVSEELDVKKGLTQMYTLIESRMAHWFNVASASGIDKDDKMFIEMVNLQKGVYQDWKKFIEGHADKTIDHNISIEVVNDQVGLLRNIVYEVLQELDPKLIPVFIEKINSKMNGVDYGSKEYKAYTAGIIDVEPDDE